MWRIYGRVCDGVAQFVWVPDLDPEDLAGGAYDEVSRLVSRPVVELSPAAGVGGFVNFPTWLAVTPVAPVSATAGPLPGGLSATTTATVTGIEWSPGDGSDLIVCVPWGALPPPHADENGLRAPCGWTPYAPSAPQFGGGEDLAFHGTVTLVWRVTWTATDGSGGDLGTLSTTTSTTYQVREIQTIGEGR